jgi:hypothetical protein
MPAPQKGALEPIIKGLMQKEGLEGENAPDLAGAMAETIAQALSLLLAQAMVAPGIACSPGASAAPGRLM